MSPKGKVILMKLRGFTLMELLVVIAIIAILAAILFPVFARARDKAQQNSCLAGMKNLQQGMTLYADDTNGRFPPCKPDSAWMPAIEPFVKNAQAFICDADGSPEIVQGGGEIARASYGWNNQHLAASSGDSILRKSVVYPTKMLMLADVTSGSWSIASENELRPRHNYGMNVTYVDGHAEWVALATIRRDMASADAGAEKSSARHFWYGTDD
jgi:prepilin-type N-terminal cleavage/methylation domain-containing protein/prepilin-type processing-associated H-X9-DG protein